MKEIPLTQGQFAIVDDADYDWLNQYKWCACKCRGNFYAIRQSTHIYMHRQILGLERGDKRQGDHQNHNTLDNRRDNLRVCTHRENLRNQKLQKKKTSKYKGVCWSESRKKWYAYITVNKKMKNLGRFHSEIFAAGIYDRAAKKYFGEFAHLNFLQ